MSSCLAKKASYFPVHLKNEQLFIYFYIFIQVLEWVYMEFWLEQNYIIHKFGESSMFIILISLTHDHGILLHFVIFFYIFNRV